MHCGAQSLTQRLWALAHFPLVLCHVLQKRKSGFLFLLHLLPSFAARTSSPRAFVPGIHARVHEVPYNIWGSGLRKLVLFHTLVKTSPTLGSGCLGYETGSKQIRGGTI